MNLKSKVELGTVPQTLLIPLWARAMESRKPDSLIWDSAALELIEKLDYDFSLIEKASAPIHLKVFVSRAKAFDDAIRAFIEKHPQAVIVSLGAGLDTTFSRVDNGTVHWYDLDLPEVIELRRRLIPESDRQRCIAKSFFDLSWLDDLKEGPKLFFAGGVFPYFDEDELKKFFVELSRRSPGSEIVFDASSRIGNYLMNRTIEKAKMDARAKLQVKSPEMFERWSSDIKVIGYQGLFESAGKNISWGLSTYLITVFTDVFHTSNIYHLKFGS